MWVDRCVGQVISDSSFTAFLHLLVKKLTHMTTKFSSRSNLSYPGINALCYKEILAIFWGKKPTLKSLG